MITPLTSHHCCKHLPDNKMFERTYISVFCCYFANTGTGELGYDRLNGARKIGPSYAKFVVYI